MPAYTVGLHTLGCKVSQYESEAIAEEFERRGFTVLPFDSICNVYVINTCTVTAESDRKSRQMVRRAIKTNPAAVVLVTGCSSQRSPEPLAAIDGVSYVGGTAGKMQLCDEALSILSAKSRDVKISVAPLSGARFEPMRVRRAPRTRAYVKIEDGCECRCAYCAIPDARGPVRSKLPADVISEVRGLVDSGCREVVLTGIETASYGADLDSYHLIDLIEDIDGMEGLERIRLGSLTPEIMRPAFIERLARLKTITPHFHLSMQSGCSKTLASMRRRYNAEMALSSIKLLREAIPGVMFTSDFMVGFPGESDADFEECCDFVREARFLQMHIFAYSKRDGTPASEMTGQVPDSIKHARSAYLTKLGDKIRSDILDDVIRSRDKLRVLFETEKDGVSYGHSDSFIEISAESTGVHSRMALITPLSHDGRCVSCKIDKMLN